MMVTIGDYKNAFQWAKDEIDWNEVEREMEKELIDGVSNETALNNALNIQIAAKPNKFGNTYENIGIWNKAEEDTLYGEFNDKNEVASADFNVREVNAIERRVAQKSVLRSERISDNTLRVYELAADGETEVEFDLNYTTRQLDLAEESGILR